MTNESNPGSSEKNKDGNESDGELLDDLESIKTLLDDEQNSNEEIPLDDDVPLLDDPIAQKNRNQGIPEDTFNALLNDTWRDSVEDLFVEARSTIEQHSTSWLPEDTDELAHALKVRIDLSVREWLGQTLQANIAELHKHVVSSLSKEILDHLKNKIAAKPATPPGPLRPNRDQNKDG